MDLVLIQDRYLLRYRYHGNGIMVSLPTHYTKPVKKVKQKSWKAMAFSRRGLGFDFEKACWRASRTIQGWQIFRPEAIPKTGFPLTFSSFSGIFLE
jgi:hypothetical protein